MFPTSTPNSHHKAKVSLLFCKLTWPEFFHLYFRVIVKCTADLGLGKGGTSGKYFQSNYLEFRGIGLGEKALGISANGAANRHEFTNSIAVALGILMIFSTVVNWRHLLFVKCTSTFRTECDHCCSFIHIRIKYWRGVKRLREKSIAMFCLPCRVC